MSNIIKKLERDTRYLQIISGAPKEECVVGAMQHNNPSAYSQREIAELCGVSRQVIGRILKRVKKKIGEEAYNTLELISNLSEEQGLPWYTTQQGRMVA